MNKSTSIMMLKTFCVLFILQSRHDAAAIKQNLNGSQAISNMSCIVNNWNDNMECRWGHPDLSVTDDKQVIVQYIVQDTSQQSFQMCPLKITERTFTSCKWDDDFLLGFYEIKITIENTERNEKINSTRWINTNDIVKPAQVVELTAQLLPAPTAHPPIKQCCLLQWKHHKTWNKIFRISHQREGDSFRVVRTNHTEQTYKACDLEPNSYHNFSVECLPANPFSGNWSDPVYVNFYVEESAPELGPETTKGSYVTSECQDGQQNITLYWQEVPLNARNGRITSYQVLSDRFCKDEVVDASVLTAQLQCSCNVTAIHIFALNKKGNYSSVVQISSLKVPKVVQNSLTVHWDVENSSVEFSWTSIDTLSYSLYWCQRRPPYYFSCQSNISWSVSAQPPTVIKISGPGQNFIFGISVTNLTQNMASGIFWAACLLKRHAAIPAPTIRYVGQDSDSVIVAWSPVDCMATYVQVTHYIVIYCHSSSCKHANRSLEVPWNSTSVRLADLEPDDYNLTVLSRSQDGVSNQSTWHHVKVRPVAGPMYYVQIIIYVCIILGCVGISFKFYRDMKNSKNKFLSLHLFKNDIYWTHHISHRFNSEPETPCHRFNSEPETPCHRFDSEPETPCHRFNSEPETPCHRFNIEPETPCHRFDSEPETPCHRFNIEPETPCHRFNSEPETPCHRNDSETPCHRFDSEPETPCHRFNSEPETPCHRNDSETPCHRFDSEPETPYHRFNSAPDSVLSCAVSDQSCVTQWTMLDTCQDMRPESHLSLNDTHIVAGDVMTYVSSDIMTYVSSDVMTYVSSDVTSNQWSSRVTIADDLPELTETKRCVTHKPAPATHIPTPATHIPTPATQVPTPATHIPTPATQVPTPAKQVPTPATQVPTPATQVPTPATHIPTPATQTQKDGAHITSLKYLVIGGTVKEQ
ncbi:uncharacterized protein LOC131941613 [Physella acuta]|uniref:uncharacterized protein LOC131941613 n=1 Tax=Physella acuta TaxID=109671 RepID=UPI0027DB4B1E|nr:uncharacterized protein LOC131941613 [Physella acuta]